MSFVRPFVASDIPRVARLHQMVWRVNGARSDSYDRYFTHVFLENPAADGLRSSLVCEDKDGRIAGFVGIVPRRVAIGGRYFQAAVSSQFIVQPGSHAGLTAMQLARAFVDGPQDLSIADEANDAARRLWEGLGGTVALLHSLFWMRPLRPARLALSYIRRVRGLALPAAVADNSVAVLADRAITRWRGGHFRPQPPAACAGTLSGQTASASAAEFCDSASLRVVYDNRTFQWLLDRIAQRNGGGRLLNVVLRKGATPLGWYVCHLDGNGIADVAQLAATPSTIHDVLGHLFHEAWRHGAMSVTGRLDPRFMQALSDKFCFFHRRGPWVLIKSKRPELLAAFESGNAWFSPLDGEWSLRFAPDEARTSEAEC